MIREMIETMIKIFDERFIAKLLYSSQSEHRQAM
jgi:hypothetical protein